MAKVFSKTEKKNIEKEFLSLKELEGTEAKPIKEDISLKE